MCFGGGGGGGGGGEGERCTPPDLSKDDSIDSNTGICISSPSLLKNSCMKPWSTSADIFPGKE